MKEEESQDIQARKKTIILYDDLLESTEDLTSEQLGEVMRLLWRKNKDNNLELSHKDTLVRLTAKLLWDTISACNKNHAKKSEQQRAAGRASAEARRKKQAELEAKAEQAEQLNTVKPEATKPENKKTMTNCDSLNTQKVQKSQQLTTQEKKKAQISKIVNKLNWNTTAGLQLSDEDKCKIVEIRLNNKKIKREQREYTQAALNLMLPEIKISIDAGIPVQEIFSEWEGNGWIKWMHSWYAKESARDIKAQSIAGDSNKMSFAQGDKLDKAFQEIKTTLQFCYSTYIDPLCPPEKKGEWNAETIRSNVQDHLKDFQLSDNQQSMLLRKLQAWLIVEHKEVSQEMNFNIQVGAQLKIGGAGHE